MHSGSRRRREYGRSALVLDGDRMTGVQRMGTVEGAVAVELERDEAQGKYRKSITVMPYGGNDIDRPQGKKRA